MAVVAFAARHAPVSAEVGLRLGMAQLAPDGLSEQWILRFCGDQHWALIAQALGLGAAVFHAPDGRPVYAAFCATSLRTLPCGALLGRDLRVASSLYAVTETRTGSQHRITVDGAVIAEVSMISTFVSHEASGCNNRIHRNSVLGELSLLPAGSDLMRLDRHARERARRMRGMQLASGPVIHSERPVPALDFNAVGLLYFPTFSRIAEAAAYRLTGRSTAILQREVVYLGNINPGDTVDVFGQDSKMVMARADRVPIAVIETRSASV